MNRKSLLGVLVIIALGVGGFMAVRYTQQVGDQLTAGTDTGGGGKPRVRFVKNPRVIPELTMTTLDGKTITNKDLAGKVTIFNFWATWCAPCRAEIPDLVKLQEQYKDHLVVIGVLSEDDPGPHVSRFAADYKINYPIVVETKQLTDAFPGIYALPTTFMVGPDLKMMQKHIGQIRPSQIELETRVLAKLSVDARGGIRRAGGSGVTREQRARDGHPRGRSLDAHRGAEDARAEAAERGAVRLWMRHDDRVLPHQRFHLCCQPETCRKGSRGGTREVASTLDQQ